MTCTRYFLRNLCIVDPQRPLIFVGTCLTAIALFLVMLGTTANANDERLLAELRLSWNARRAAISAAKITARTFISGGDSVKPISFDELQALLPVDAAGGVTEEQLRDLVMKLRANFAGSGPLLGDIVFATDGDHVSQNSFVRLTSDARAAVFADSKQKLVSLYPPTNSPYIMLRLGSFSLELERAFGDKLAVVATDASISRLRETYENGAEGEITVDSQTHMVTTATTRIGGRVLRHRAQCGIIEYPDGVTLPELSVEASFDKGLLGFVQILHPVKVELNEPMATQEFAVAMPMGTLISDYRHNALVQHRLDNDVSDVVEYADSASPSSALEHYSHSGPSKWIFILNASAVAVVAVWYFTRRRSMRK